LPPGRHNQKTKTKMKKMKFQIAIVLGSLFAFIDRLTAPRGAVALPNALGLINEHGIESLLLDLNSVAAPFPGRYLLVMRGATGYQYGDLCGGGSTLAQMPLGPTSDSPYGVGDIMNVRRLGARPGLEMGIAAAAITIDHLVCATAAGKIADLTTIANGTYWVVGRAVATIAATSSTMECGYVPCNPYLLTNTGGTLTMPTNPL
jgi:hypothetical protein